MTRRPGDLIQAGAASLIVLGLGLLCGTTYTWLSGVSPSPPPARGLAVLWLAAGLLAGLAFFGCGFLLWTSQMRRQARRRESEAWIIRRMHERLGLVPVHNNGDGEDDTQAGQKLELIPPATPWAGEQIT